MRDPKHDMTMLEVSLEEWVSVRIHELRHLDADALTRLTVECARRTGGQGDALMFGGDSAGEAWAELVTGLAALALLSPDGVTWRRMHWCTGEHPGCAAYRVEEEPRA